MAFTGAFLITIYVRMRVGWLKGLIRRHCGMTADAFQPVLGIQTAFFPYCSKYPIATKEDMEKMVKYIVEQGKNFK